MAVTITLVGLAVELIGERRRRFEALAADHESELIYGIGCSFIGPPVYYDRNDKIMTAAEVEAVGWHKKLAQKYRSAAAKPWLPVEPDPPPP